MEIRTINLKKRKGIYKVRLADEYGNLLKDKNGKDVILEFDLDDVELPLKYNECIEQVKKCKIEIKNKLIIIKKKQDHKGKNALLSDNEKESAQAINEFYSKMIDAMDLFLGKNGTKKVLNGKSPYYEMFDDIDEMLKPCYSEMNITINGLKDRIMNKYNSQKEKNTI